VHNPISSPQLRVVVCQGSTGRSFSTLGRKRLPGTGAECAKWDADAKNRRSRHPGAPETGCGSFVSDKRVRSKSFFPSTIPNSAHRCGPESPATPQKHPIMDTLSGSQVPWPGWRCAPLCPQGYRCLLPRHTDIITCTLRPTQDP